MNFIRPPYLVFRPAALVLAGLLAVAAALSAADAPAPASNGTFSPPKEGEVLALPLREKLLVVIKTFLNRTDSEFLPHLKNSANPFFPKLVPVAEPTAPASNGSANSTPAPVQLSPADKLQQLADQLRPSGALISGQNRFIIFASGDTLALGQAIHVTFPGDSAPSEILLQEVTSDSFTLKLGDTAKQFPFVAKGNASRSAPPTISPPPKKS